MAFWNFKRRQETPEERAARKAARARRDAQNYDAIMAAFVQPLPTFSQWTAPVAKGHPPAYDVSAHNTYYPATYYPHQSYENPYGNQPYYYSSCPSSSGGSVASTEILPTYVDSTYNPYSRQVCTSFQWLILTDATGIDVLLAITSISHVRDILGFSTSINSSKERE
jgi:hypothetical protein